MSIRKIELNVNSKSIFIVSRSGSKKPSRDKKLLEIGTSGKMAITYEKVARPPLILHEKG